MSLSLATIIAVVEKQRANQTADKLDKSKRKVRV